MVKKRELKKDIIADIENLDMEIAAEHMQRTNALDQIRQARVFITGVSPMPVAEQPAPQQPAPTQPEAEQPDQAEANKGNG